MSSLPQPILQVSHLHVAFSRQDRQQQVVTDANFAIYPGEMLALVGESGSGKSLTALALLGLLPPPHCQISAGTIIFQGDTLSTQSEEEWQNLRGNRLSMIFQEPMTALNPVLTVRVQLAEVLQRHLKLHGQILRQHCLELLGQVGIPEPQHCLDLYPHQLSGGMRQRVMIAMALACKPKLLIADEPTTALDVTVQAQIMALLNSLRRECGTAVLFITHNMALVAQYADRCAVMYAGQIVEYADNQALFAAPTHPYTRLLLRAMPQSGTRGQQLAAIPGLPPRPDELPTGCRFSNRCPFVRDICRDQLPPGTAIAPQHWVSCHRQAEELPLPLPPSLRAPVSDALSPEPILQVKNLRVQFRHRGSGRHVVNAVDGIDFTLRPGETLALVGESGCGKTSAGKALLGLFPEAASGEVLWQGTHNLLKLSEKKLRPLRKNIQMIFQDPFSSLNPRMTLGEILAEGMQIHGLCVLATERSAQKDHLMRQVGLDPEWLNRYPHQLSGGQRQRLGLARILALQPQIILCDECTSALDVSVQAQILNLLKEIQLQTGVAYLFITHDLSVVEYLADRIAVMYLGKIVETGPAFDIFARPRHPYTRTLLAAAPVLGKPATAPPVADLAQSSSVGSGCRFRFRCQQALPLCAIREPLLHACSNDHFVSCHVVADLNASNQQKDIIP